MNFGISTSCFYPRETEIAFRTLAELGNKTVEIFINARSEIDVPIFEELLEIKREYGINVVSVHSMASFAEGFFVFSNYERRHTDSLEFSKPFFEAEAKLGAKFHILHGAKLATDVPKERYARQLKELIDVGKQFGINVVQENVVHYHSEAPKFMKYLADEIGDDFKMVLDVKQARRAGIDPHRFIDILFPHIVHLHLSDFSPERDCTIPKGDGNFDFSSLFIRMNELGYKGDAILEVYKDAYTDPMELIEGRKWLENKYMETVG